MPIRPIYLLNEPSWIFDGPFLEETVVAFTGHRYKEYIFITSMYQMINEHTDPAAHFLISAEQLRDTEQHSWDNGRLLGIAHRHPWIEPQPSQDDYDGIHRTLLGAVWCEGQVVWYDQQGKLTPINLFI